MRKISAHTALPWGALFNARPSLPFLDLRGCAGDSNIPRVMPGSGMLLGPLVLLSFNVLMMSDILCGLVAFTEKINFVYL